MVRAPSRSLSAASIAGSNRAATIWKRDGKTNLNAVRGRCRRDGCSRYCPWKAGNRFAWTSTLVCNRMWLVPSTNSTGISRPTHSMPSSARTCWSISTRTRSIRRCRNSGRSSIPPVMRWSCAPIRGRRGACRRKGSIPWRICRPRDRFRGLDMIYGHARSIEQGRHHMAHRTGFHG